MKRPLTNQRKVFGQKPHVSFKKICFSVLRTLSLLIKGIFSVKTHTSVSKKFCFSLFANTLSANQRHFFERNAYLAFIKILIGRNQSLLPTMLQRIPLHLSKEDFQTFCEPPFQKNLPCYDSDADSIALH